MRMCVCVVVCVRARVCEEFSGDVMPPRQRSIGTLGSRPRGESPLGARPTRGQGTCSRACRHRCRRRESRGSQFHSERQRYRLLRTTRWSDFGKELVWRLQTILDSFVGKRSARIVDPFHTHEGEMFLDRSVSSTCVSPVCVASQQARTCWSCPVRVRPHARAHITLHQRYASFR